MQQNHFKTTHATIFLLLANFYSAVEEPDCSLWTDFFLLGKAGGYNLNIKFFCKCELTL